MTTISRHISYLLLTCRKVVVPGLGTFSAIYQRATFKPEYGIFFPSRIRIQYTADSSLKDLHLSHSLKRKLDISIDDATDEINRFVEYIHFNLKRRKFCRLDGLGYLTVDNEGEINFTDTFWKFQPVSTYGTDTYISI